MIHLSLVSLSLYLNLYLQLNIVVSDRRAETDDDGVTPLTNSTTIHIVVKDVNDNEPYFNRCVRDITELFWQHPYSVSLSLSLFYCSCVLVPSATWLRDSGDL